MRGRGRDRPAGGDGADRRGRPDRAGAAARTMRALTEQAVASGVAIYGRTTGVGFNRSIEVSPEDEHLVGLRLVRSHAAGAGPLVAPEIGLAMLGVRANQIAAGGSGIDPGVLTVLADCLAGGFWPPARSYGAIGTGDLTALAVTALCLLGERDWLTTEPGARPGGQPRFALDPADMLAFMSSNAATLAEAAIACHDLTCLLRASTVIAALGHLAVRGRPSRTRRPFSGRDRIRVSCGSRVTCASCSPPRPARPPGCRILTATGRSRRYTAPPSTQRRTPWRQSGAS